MKSSRNYPAMQVKVGTLVAVAMAIALLAMIFPTKGVNPFSGKIKLVTYYPAVAGLRASSPVWFSGMEVGSVVHVDFVPGSDPPQLKVVLAVERKIQPYLKTDSQAEIKGMGLLGDMYVNLTQGTAQAESVRDGSVIAGVPPKEFTDDLETMMASAKGLLANLEQISRDLARGQGSLGLLAKDPSLYYAFRDALRDLQTVLGAMGADDQGTLAKLVHDPALYDELVAAVRDVRTVVADLKQTEQKLLSPETKETLDQTVATASRMIKKFDEQQKKVDLIKLDLNFGVSRYAQAIASGHAHVQIWPSPDRYYLLGLQKITDLYGYETERTTWEAQLAWRILQTPLFIRGGLIRSEYFVGGLDLRLQDDDLNFLLDAYRVEYNPMQLDLRAGVVVWDLLEFTAGAENILQTPFYKAGLTIHYRDDDLFNVLVKTAW
jgi:phospholipid/cholesterol/gamma-HCH transport system substrate-binding protein